jgi:hypothetical protein
MDDPRTSRDGSDMAEVALDMEPLLHQSGEGGASSGMRKGVVTQRRDVGADAGWFGGVVNARDRDDNTSAPSPTAGSYDTSLVFRPMRAVPLVRKLSLRAQTVIGRVDDVSMTALSYLGDVPAVRVGFLSWLVVLHAWIMLLQSFGCHI